MRWSLAVVTVVWLGLIAAGGYELFVFETTAGAAGLGTSRWPDAVTLTRAPVGLTVVLFAHPGCACTRASLAELESSLADAPVRPRVIVAFVGPTDPTASAAWQAAGRIAGAARVRLGAAEARRFGARTSGHVAIYDETGALRFAGGVTGSRGHVGANVGRQAVRAALRGAPGLASHAVFGCALEDD